MNHTHTHTESALYSRQYLLLQENKFFFFFLLCPIKFYTLNFTETVIPKDNYLKRTLL